MAREIYSAEIDLGDVSRTAGRKRKQLSTKEVGMSGYTFSSLLFLIEFLIPFQAIPSGFDG